MSSHPAVSCHAGQTALKAAIRESIIFFLPSSVFIISFLISAIFCLPSLACSGVQDLLDHDEA
jgi:hypothetical protein